MLKIRKIDRAIRKMGNHVENRENWGHEYECITMITLQLYLNIFFIAVDLVSFRTLCYNA